MHQGGLLEGDEDRAHAGDVFGLLAGLGVKVTQPGHPFPLSAWGRLINVIYKGFFCCPGSNNKICWFNVEPAVSYLVAAFYTNDCVFMPDLMAFWCFKELQPLGSKLGSRHMASSPRHRVPRLPSKMLEYRCLVQGARSLSLLLSVSASPDAEH